MKTKNEKPILFSTPMVQAILGDRKTMTRRIVKFPKDFDGRNVYSNDPHGLKYSRSDDMIERLFPKYKVGDVLWVRETWRIISWGDGDPFRIQYKDMTVRSGVYLPEENALKYFIQCEHDCLKAGLPRDRDGIWRFNAKNAPTRWRPSIFMPRSAARIFLKVTRVRVEILQDISGEDAMKEGVKIESMWPLCIGDSYRAFSILWESINGKGSWDANPWVWVYEFERVEQ